MREVWGEAAPTRWWKRMSQKAAAAKIALASFECWWCGWKATRPRRLNEHTGQPEPIGCEKCGALVFAK